MPDHVKIPDIRPRVQHVADGIATQFDYPFPIFASEDLKVWFNLAEQTSGFTVFGAGNTPGGTVEFTTPPTLYTVITLERRVPLERIGDFLEGGEFAAVSINNELDYVTASIQQVYAGTIPLLRFDAREASPITILPGRAQRAGKAFSFDGDGNPTVADIDQIIGPPSFVANGSGAITRGLTDKAKDLVSVKDFGAVGDGLVDDIQAFQMALAAAQSVLVPTGTYLVSAPIEVGYAKQLFGTGQSSVIRALNNSFDAVRMPSGYAAVHSLRIEKGLAGIRLYGRDGVCVQNSVHDVTVWQSTYGLVLDGYVDPDFPCYWNNFDRVLLVQPEIHGVWLMRSGAGDTPNANRFHMVRVYSLAAPTSGSGFYVQHGRYNNAFVDCEANLSTTAHSCFRLGPDTDKNLIVNLYTETLDSIPNVLIEAGSVETSIVNLFSASAGPAIQDLSGGNYTAYNAGFPDKNRMGKTRVTDLTTELLRFDTEYFEADGEATLIVDLSASVYLVSAANGEIQVLLPEPDEANGAQITIKKTDDTHHFITLATAEGDGPDGRAIQLGSRYDYVTAVSNGAGWWIVAHNLMPGNAQFHEGAALFEPDLTRQLYLVSAFAGAVQARLPPADAPEAAGRMVTIKKSDSSANAVTITERGGPGPDNESIVLTGQGHALTIMSDGNGWHILARYS